METISYLIIITLLAILAEVTYLVVKLPRQNFSKKQGRLVFVDTSVLIDGRIIAVAESNFIGDTLIIPRSVIGELQYLADNADHDKRARARHGLDVVKQLQQMPLVATEIMQDGSKAEEGVDERLLNLAKQHSGVICTIDFNLNKVAQVEGITVLNVNELAQSLRMAYLPGEKMLLEVVQKGQDSHQGVGYLADGTMVVIEHAQKNIGQTVEIEFIRSLQTAAGKMMFAKRVDAQVPKAAVKQPIEKVAKALVKKPTGRAPAPVYHSDKQDTSIAKKQSAPSRESPKKHNQSRDTKKPSRPRRSVDREAALIDLVEQQ